MPQLTPEQLEAFFHEYGWEISAEGPGFWRTGFAGDHGYYPLRVHLTPTCLSFEVRPLGDFGDVDPHLALGLLELNSRLQLVKIGTCEAGELSLSCQVLALGVTFDVLSRILGIIGYYADEVSLEIAQKLESRAPPRPPHLLS